MSVKRIAMFAIGLIKTQSVRTNIQDLSATVDQVLRLFTTIVWIRKFCLIVQVSPLLDL